MKKYGGKIGKLLAVIVAILPCAIGIATPSSGSVFAVIGSVVFAVLAVDAILCDDITKSGSILRTMSKKRSEVMIITLLHAISPSVAAIIESDFGDVSMIADRSYIAYNFVYNILGALLVCMLFNRIAGMLLNDTIVFKGCVPLSPLNISAPLALLVGFGYQELEMMSNVVGHTTSLSTAHVTLNLISLIWLTNLTVLSVLYRITYIIKAIKGGHIPIPLDKMHYVRFSLIIFYCYLLSTSTQLYVSKVYIPAVLFMLIGEVARAAVSIRTIKAAEFEMAFVTSHSMLFAVLFLWKEDFISRSPYTWLFWGALLLTIGFAILYLIAYLNDDSEEDDNKEGEDPKKVE